MDGSDTLVAVMATSAVAGAVAGAVYSPPEEIVPQATPLQPDPVAVQFTVVLEVPVTEAVNCCVAPTASVTVVGDTATETTAGVVPVPLRPISAVLFVEELLTMVS